jgi:hypothetical protein
VSASQATCGEASQRGRQITTQRLCCDVERHPVGVLGRDGLGVDYLTDPKLPQFVATVTADDVCRDPIEPRSGISAREVVSVSATEGRHESLRHEVVAALPTDTSRDVAVDDRGVLVEEHTKVGGVGPRLLDHGRVIASRGSLLRSNATNDWSSHGLGSGEFTLTTVIAKLTDCGSRRAFNVYAACFTRKLGTLGCDHVPARQKGQLRT